MVGDYAKVRMVKNDTWFALAEFMRSFGMCTRYFFRTYFPYLLDVLLLVGVYALYLFVADKIGMAGKVAIILMVIIQTLVMFFRLGTRLFALGSANLMHDAIQHKENPIDVVALPPFLSPPTMLKAMTKIQTILTRKTNSIMNVNILQIGHRIKMERSDRRNLKL